MARNIGDGATKEYSHKKSLVHEVLQAYQFLFCKKKMLSKIQIFSL